MSSFISSMKVGVLDVQGDVKEHVIATRNACRSLGIDAEVLEVRSPKAINAISGLVIPGGESTTVGKLIVKYGMDKAILDVAGDIPIFGTCAGMVLLSKEGARMKDGQPLLGLLDAKVVRNAYGRQCDSFEADLRIPVIGEECFHGVFIRAPALEKVWGRCKCLCKLEGRIVLARQDNLLASAFHPELTDDTRLHEYFLEMI
jgi:pyridoxal 5'-phosphate synthase pdxT subunit